jgi:hypothetical protein
LITEADVLVVRGDPLADLEALTDPLLVIHKGGRDPRRDLGSARGLAGTRDGDLPLGLLEMPERTSSCRRISSRGCGLRVRRPHEAPRRLGMPSRFSPPSKVRRSGEFRGGRRFAT